VIVNPITTRRLSPCYCIHGRDNQALLDGADATHTRSDAAALIEEWFWLIDRRGVPEGEKDTDNIAAARLQADMLMPPAMKVIGHDVVDCIINWVMDPVAPGQRAARWIQIARQPARDNLWRRGQTAFRQMTRDAKMPLARWITLAQRSYVI
jgi:hypothetical protein